MMHQTYRFTPPGDAATWPRFFHKLMAEALWAAVERFGGPYGEWPGGLGAYQDQELSRMLQERYQCRVVRDRQREMFLEWNEEKYYAWFLLKWSGK